MRCNRGMNLCKVNVYLTVLLLIARTCSAMADGDREELISDKASVKVLERELARHQHLYEAGDSPELLDVEYDRLEEQWRTMREGSESPEIQRRTVDDGSGGPIGVHLTPMLSLRKAKKPEDVESAFERMKERFGWGPSVGLVVEAKHDGVAISLVYEDGVFKQALSRGDGDHGLDWTQKALAIGGFPLILDSGESGPKLSGLMELRGEVTISRSQLAAQMATRDPDKSSQLVNPRTYAASTMQLEDLSKIQERRLSITVFAIGTSDKESSIWTREAFRAQLVDWGFAVPEAVYVAGIAGLGGVIRDFWETVKDGDQPLDGLVIKLNRFVDWEAAGWTRQGPVGAIAWKPRGPVGVTRVVAIEWEPSRHGALIPVAVLEPVEIANREVKRVHLHNRSIQASLGIQKGTRLEIELAGDTIPIVGRILSGSGATLGAEAPVACPECGEALQWIEPHLRCPGSDCRGIQWARLCWFVERMGIRGLGEGTLKQLMKEGLVDGPVALYELPLHDSLLASLVGQEAAGNICRSLEASKRLGAARWIEAIGIEGVGAAKARELERLFGSLAAVEAFWASEQAKIEKDFEEPVSRLLMSQLQHHFENPDRRLEWRRLARIQERAVNAAGLPMN